MSRRRHLAPCSVNGCGQLTNNSRCPTHTHLADKARGTSTQRGYGTAHQNERRKWAPAVATGTVRCARCHQHIHPGTPWDLDHTDDRRSYLGPSHATCNRAAR